MKNIILLHGFEGTIHSNWHPWLGKKLREKGYNVINESFPNPAHPKIEDILKFYDEIIKDQEIDTIIGHSLGAYIALKLALTYPLKKIILVAPAIFALPYDVYKHEWHGSDVDSLEKVCSEPIDLSNIKAEAKIAIFSKDDPWIPFENRKLFDKDWQIVEYENLGHFQSKRFPELFELFLKIKS